MVDTSLPLPLEIQLETNSIALTPEESKEFEFIISPKTQKDLLDVSLILNSTHDFLTVSLDSDAAEISQLNYAAPQPIHVTISASEDAVSGIYKILLGAQLPDVAVSKFITVTIE